MNFFLKDADNRELSKKCCLDNMRYADHAEKIDNPKKQRLWTA